MTVQTRFLRRVALLAVPLASTAACTTTSPWQFEEGDHVVIIGNALADRMQHDGWLEAYLQTELPELRLVIRSQGFSRVTESTTVLEARGFRRPTIT